MAVIPSFILINSSLMAIWVLFLIFAFFQQTLPSVQPEFKAQIIGNDITIGYGVALGDVDGDGKPDILLADKKEFVWYRNGDWKRFVMIENLTEHDNVAIAARDITGDGKVEVAVGAQWNPSETSDASQSGSVHYLQRPVEPTQPWQAIKLPHEPTVHRMRWVKSSEGNFFLVVLPLHGRGNIGGEGQGVIAQAYEFPEDPKNKWNLYTLDDAMHLTHNFDVIESEDGTKTEMYIAGKEGVRFIVDEPNNRPEGRANPLPGMTHGAGEVRLGKLSSGNNFLVTVEPMHGNSIVVYLKDAGSERIVIDDNVNEGHALAVADFLGTGSDQVVAGWRNPNKDGKVGVKIYIPENPEGTKWRQQWIDEDGMACEDLQAIDLNGNGKVDIVASGRATKNLKVYWNQSGSK